MARTGRPPSHGMSYTPEHRAWRHMIERCYVKNSVSYPWYGAKGITVYEAWRNDFMAFFADMGPCPAGHSLDRAKTTEPYEPGNCRWADRVTQANNTTRNVVVEWDGQELTVAEWARELGLKYHTLYKRIVIDGRVFPDAAAPLYARKAA